MTSGEKSTHSHTARIRVVWNYTGNQCNGHYMYKNTKVMANGSNEHFVNMNTTITIHVTH